MAFKEVGLNIHFQDVIDESPYYVRLSEVGIMSRYPFASVLAPEGYAPDQGEYKTLDTWCDVEIFVEKAV